MSLNVDDFLNKVVAANQAILRDYFFPPKEHKKQTSRRYKKRYVRDSDEDYESTTFNM